MIQALAGNQTAYARVLKKTTRLIRPYLTKRLAAAADVEDVMQEILISLHKARHTYDGKRPFGPWIFAIAKYRLNDYLRSRYADPLRYMEDLETAENISESDVTKTGFSYESIKEEVEQLPRRQGAIVKLMHEDGYTSKETAKILGMKESAVKVSAFRAYKILRKKLGG